MGRKAGGKQLGQMERQKLRSWHQGGELSSGHPMSPWLQMNRELKRVKMSRTQLYMKCLHRQHGREPGTEKAPLFPSTG